MACLLRSKSVVVGTALLCVALGSYGLTLGTVQGTTALGQPLDVQVPLQLDALDDAGTLCLGANVLYGDTPLDPARTSVRLEPAGAGAVPGEARVRIQSSTRINEAILTLHLRVGCQQTLSRKYVLFPDAIADVAHAKSPVLALSVPMQKAEPAQRIPAQHGTLLAAANLAGPAKVKVRAAASAPVGRAPAARANLSSARKPGRPRLQLEALDIVVDQDLVLRASPELLTMPLEDLQKRADALALWAALNTNPQQRVHNASAAQSLDRELQSVRATVDQDQKKLVNLQSKLHAAESQRYNNGLVYALAGFCVLTLLAMAGVAQRLRTVQTDDWTDGLTVG